MERWDRKTEQALIAAIRERAAKLRYRGNKNLILGIGDDCAVLRPAPGRDLVVTTDLFLERVHFRREWHPPESAGHRCLARGLSDLAAMGARPEAAFLSVAIPRELRGSWLQRFLEGWMRLAERFHVPLAGGDTAQSPSQSDLSGKRSREQGLFMADVTLLGSVPRGKALQRSGARAGDLLYVTGRLGGAAAELRSIAHRPKAFSREVKAGPEHPHLYPEPRLGAGQRLLRLGAATAAIDISDGLSTDLMHLCEAGNVAAEVDREALPLAPGATLEEGLHGGEDYEILFTAKATTKVPRRLAGVAIHRIGKMTKYSSGIRMKLAGKGGARRLDPGGWEHFGS